MGWGRTLRILGMSFPTPSWPPGECQRAVLASKPQPQGPSFRLCPSPPANWLYQFWDGAGPGAKSVQRAKATHCPVTRRRVLLGEWARALLDLVRLSTPALALDSPQPCLVMRLRGSLGGMTAFS